MTGLDGDVYGLPFAHAFISCNRRNPTIDQLLFERMGTESSKVIQVKPGKAAVTHLYTQRARASPRHRSFIGSASITVVISCDNCALVTASRLAVSSCQSSCVTLGTLILYMHWFEPNRPVLETCSLLLLSWFSAATLQGLS